MKIFRNFFVVLIFAFLSFNFLFDFTYINKHISNNLNQFVYKYILIHKNTINLKSQIKTKPVKTNKIINYFTKPGVTDKTVTSFPGTGNTLKTEISRGIKSFKDAFSGSYKNLKPPKISSKIVKAANVLGKASRFAGKLSAYALPIEYLRQGFLRGKKQGFKIDPNQKSIIKEGKKKPINRKFSIYKR